MNLFEIACQIGEVVSGYIDTRLSSICKSENVNKWSRYRPGYWTVGTSQNIYFQRPRGGSYTDPRGADASGETKEGFKLGDFRNYNHATTGIAIDGIDNPTIYLPSNQSTSGWSTEIVVDLGEVDWFNQSSDYWCKNYGLSEYNQIIVVNASGTVLGTCSISNLETSGNRKRAVFNMTLPVPASAGQTVTTTIKVGIGKTNKLYYYLPDLTRTYTIIRTALPFWQMYASTAGKQSLYSNLSGATPTGTSVYELKLYPSYGTFNSGSTSLTLALTDTIVQMYPTYDEYRVTQLRWTVGGTVYVYNSSGTLLNSWTFSQVLAASGTGAYNMTIPLSTAALDGYQYKIELNSFGTTQISNL